MIRFRDHCTAVCDTCVYTRRFSRHEKWKLTKERTAGGKLIPPGHRLGHPVLLFFANSRVEIGCSDCDKKEEI